MTPSRERIDVDALAQEIRRVDGDNSLGAGALAEALLPFLSSTGGVKVKPLEWGAPYEDASGYVSYDASSIVGGFAVYRVKPDLLWIAEGSGMGKRIGAFDTEDEAKAAAQADYDARILSALSAAPVPEAGGWPVIVDGDKRYVVPPDQFSILMGHGLLGSRSDGTYRLSDSEEMQSDPGSAGVNNPKALAVLAVVRAALYAARLPVDRDGWQPIETAPRDESYIIVYQSGVLEPSQTICCFDPAWGADGWWLCCDGKDAELPLRGPEPTHWRPLPVPPKASPATTEKADG